MARFTTMDHREITSRSRTLNEAIRSARNAWWNGSDDRIFRITNPSGTCVAQVHKGVVIQG